MIFTMNEVNWCLPEGAQLQPVKDVKLVFVWLKISVQPAAHTEKKVLIIDIKCRNRNSSKHLYFCLFVVFLWPFKEKYRMSQKNVCLWEGIPNDKRTFLGHLVIDFLNWFSTLKIPALKFPDHRQVYRLRSIRSQRNILLVSQLQSDHSQQRWILSPRWKPTGQLLH